MSDKDLQYRSFAPEIEIRSSEGDGRTVYGIAVPYGRPQRIDTELTEMFSRGAFNDQINSAHRVHYSYGHMSQNGQLLGRVNTLRDDASGLYFEARIAATVAGDEVLALIRDGALDQHSIGFVPKQSRNIAGGVTERVRATLREISVVLDGAYGEAAVAMGVRSACPHCGHVEQARSGLDEVRLILAGLPEVLPLG